MWLEIDQAVAVIIGVPKGEDGEEDWSNVYLYPLDAVLATNPQKGGDGDWTGLMNDDLDREDIAPVQLKDSTIRSLKRWEKKRETDGSPKFILTAKLQAAGDVKIGRVRTKNLIRRGLIGQADVDYLMFLEQHSHELALYELEQAKATATAKQAEAEAEKRRKEREKQRKKQRRRAHRRRQRELDDALLEQRAW